MTAGADGTHGTEGTDGPAWPPGVVDAVLAHMNGDHRDDSLVIARAFGRPDATAAEMVGLDDEGGVWWVETVDEAGGDGSELRVPWPSGPITERAAIRREVVALYDAACARLGVPARPDRARNHQAGPPA